VAGLLLGESARLVLALLTLIWLSRAINRVRLSYKPFEGGMPQSVAPREMADAHPELRLHPLRIAPHALIY
jgi:hypothetical protein